MPYWLWFAIGAALLVLEVFAPGAAFLWFGLSALIVGALSFGVPALPVWIEILLFAGLAGGALWLWKRHRALLPADPNPAPMLNRRDQQLLGQTLTLETPIQNGRGQARVLDSLWLVEGPDLPAGRAVRVVGGAGTVLKVEPLE
jgi:inner membrane protein